MHFCFIPNYVRFGPPYTLVVPVGKQTSSCWQLFSYLSYKFNALPINARVFMNLIATNPKNDTNKFKAC